MPLDYAVKMGMGTKREKISFAKEATFIDQHRIGNETKIT